ncbi:hypothetical protein D081_2127 [Anaerovibrio sp. JC8]|uniref:hypothetical protein n=1 Tax=Anaerovibrio sp. JC8 TaxID=1240085 RepID=UPI000A0B31F2|nr:hypothetical protein [Anaerovibrio sp. JC8]ORT99157.1 hypothetical protein D081_2127 [Anaerovibrio sp. JC8]
MKAAVRLSAIERLLMNVNTHHYSFLEGENLHSAKEDEVSYRLKIHELRIGTFAALVVATALAICL